MNGFPFSAHPLHDVTHGGQVGVEARTYILDVINDHNNAFHIFS